MLLGQDVVEPLLGKDFSTAASNLIQYAAYMGLFKQVDRPTVEEVLAGAWAFNGHLVGPMDLCVTEAGTLLVTELLGDEEEHLMELEQVSGLVDLDRPTTEHPCISLYRKVATLPLHEQAVFMATLHSFFVLGCAKVREPLHS